MPLWPSTLAGWWLTMRGSHSESCVTYWSGGLLKLHDKLKIYCYYQSFYDHETWQDSNLRDILFKWSWKISWQTKVVVSFCPMATKLGRMVTYLEGLLPIKSHDTLTSWILRDHNIFTITVPIATNRGRILTYLEGLAPRKLLDPLVTWSCNITWQTKTIISTTSMSMATKLNRMLTQLDGLLPI